jgi:ubiquinone/menaquinone biosynthesis C-methylase UbiE
MGSFETVTERSNNDVRKEYMREIYSKYWVSAREKIYKDLPYDKHLIDIIELLNIRESILEIAIGTGIPFGKYFYKRIQNFKGIDISPLLVEECKRLNPGIDVVVGDAEYLPFPDCFFNLTYCFHSSWYFPDIKKAINEMIRVTNDNGAVIFDIINMANPEIVRQNSVAIKRSRNKFYPLVHFIKKLVKILIGKPYPWTFIYSISPTDPYRVINLLEKYSLAIYGRTNKENLILIENPDNIPDYTKLVFLVRKMKK